MPSSADPKFPPQGDISPAGGATPQPPARPSILDLRLSQNQAELTHGRQLLVSVAVAKPPKAFFFRVLPDEDATTILNVLDATKLGGEGVFAVSAEIAGAIADQVRLVQLRAAVTSQGVPYLVPLTLPGPDGRWNQWHQSLARALERAETSWIRISANMFRGGYDVYEAIGQLPAAQWPDESFEKLLEIAFRDRLITSKDHPLVQQLLGAT